MGSPPDKAPITSTLPNRKEFSALILPFLHSCSLLPSSLGCCSSTAVATPQSMLLHLLLCPTTKHLCAQGSGFSVLPLSICVLKARASNHSLSCVCCCLVAMTCSTLLQPHGQTVAHQAPLCMRLLGHECWSGLPLLSPGDLPHPGIKPLSVALQADSLLLSHQGSPSLSHLQSLPK